MSRIGGIINEMNNTTFLKERQINNRFIDLSNKQRIMNPLILDIISVEVDAEVNDPNVLDLSRN